MKTKAEPKRAGWTNEDFAKVFQFMNDMTYALESPERLVEMRELLAAEHAVALESFRTIADACS